MKETILQACIGFEWDEGNVEKNWDKHKVSTIECEQIFFNRPLLLYDDTKHSAKENRMYVLGKTDAGRLLFIAFTVRDKKLIRVISARNMSQKERIIYAQCEKEDVT